MICWSCEKNVPADVFCASCKAILPPAPGTDHFAALGQLRRYSIDVGAAEARYKELTRAVHPDKFAKADPRARRAAMQRTVQINEAWRTLRDPFARAEYLLSLAGVTAAPAVEQALLIDMLEKREALADARAAGNANAVDAMAAEMRARLAQSMATVAAGLDAGADMTDVARELGMARYYRRFLEDVEHHGGDAAVAGAL